MSLLSNFPYTVIKGPGYPRWTGSDYEIGINYATFIPLAPDTTIQPGHRVAATFSGNLLGWPEYGHHTGPFLSTGSLRFVDAPSYDHPFTVQWLSDGKDYVHNYYEPDFEHRLDGLLTLSLSPSM